jgi:hypothetical protein
MEIVTFVLENKVVLLAFALATSEVLALIPNIKSSSIFELIVAGIKKIAGK